MKYLAVKHFDTFQHYRDRNPPWIKLYARLLTDLSFLEIPEAAQAQLVKLWILASQMGNPLPNNPRLLAGKIGTTGKFHLAAIIASGFLIPCNEFASTDASTDASTALAECSQDSSSPVCARSQSELEDHENEGREGAPVPEPALTALYLTIWANNAVTERWGESIHPYIQVNAVDLAEQLVKLGVDWRVARLSIYRQCRESKKETAPRGQNYFRQGIVDDWQAELARRATIASGERAPEKAVEAPAKEHWKDRNAREAKEDRAANEWKLLTASVETRRARAIDGDIWWARMQKESGQRGADLYRYAAKHLDEPGQSQGTAA